MQRKLAESQKNGNNTVSAPDLTCDISAAGEAEEESDDRSQNEDDSIMSDEGEVTSSAEIATDNAIAV